MPRRAKPAAQDFAYYEEITVQAIKKTTIEERRAIAEEWSRGSRTNYKTLAESRGLVPAGLITAALIDAEHPILVFDGRALFKSIIEAQIIIAKAELQGTWIMELSTQPLVGSLWTNCVQAAENGQSQQ